MVLTRWMNEEKESVQKTTPKDKLFEIVELKWWEQQKDSWSEDHAARIKRWLLVDSKYITNLHIEEIDAGHITELMKTQ